MRGDDGTTGLVGYLPPVPVRVDGVNIEEGPLTVSSAKGFWDGRGWSEPSSADGDIWRPLRGDPDWFEEDAAWLNALVRTTPGWTWLAGRCSLAALGLTLQGQEADEACWALPLPGVDAGEAVAKGVS